VKVVEIVRDKVKYINRKIKAKRYGSNDKNKVRKEKQWIINDSDFKKIVRLFGEVYERADKLHELFFKDDKIYKELGRYAEDLRGVISKVNNEKKEVKTKLVEIYEHGFKSGIEFCNDTVGEFGDMIDSNIEHGHLPQNFD
jgi:hypothetical protein